MAKRERGTGSLIKINGCRYWYAQFYDTTGRQRRVSTKTEVKQEAQTTLRNLLTDKDRGVAFVGDLKKVRYGKLRADLLHSYTERGNKSLQTLADGEETIWGLKALDDFFEYKGPDDPGVPVTHMGTDAAREFVRKRQAEGVANGTINGSLALLRRMLNIAHEDGVIQVVPKIHLLKAGAARRGFLPREKFEELLVHIPALLKPLIVFLYYCGVRLGEARQIQWAQVDLKAGLIRLEEEQTKSGDPRVVPLPDVLLHLLRVQEPKEGPVFIATNLRKSWCAACAAAGLGTLEKVEGHYDKRYTGLIIHDLRRSAVRNLRKAGVAEGVAMKISGHKTRSVFERYNIVDETDVQQAMARVENNLVTVGERTVKMLRGRRTAKP